MKERNFLNRLQSMRHCNRRGPNAQSTITFRAAYVARALATKCYYLYRQAFGSTTKKMNKYTSK